jgi:hypothetical protein
MTSASRLLTLWDSGQGLSPLRRAQLLARLGRTGSAAASDVEPPIGLANADLFRLRRALFGSQLVGLASCPSCAATVEIGAEIEDFLTTADEDGGPAVHAVEIDGRLVHFRLPTLEDLAAIDAATPAETAAAMLLCACIAEPGEVAVGPAGGRVLARMAELDPLADAMLELACEACGSRFECAFDIAGFLWREIEAWGGRMLADVHAMAHHYGWAEADILAMSPARRQAYLDLIGA